MSGNVIDEHELEQHKAFKKELDQLMEGFSEDDCNVDVWMDLLVRMIDFEESLKTVAIRPFFYGYIARAALNAKKYAIAVAYAKGAIILNSIIKDELGIHVGKRVLRDLATCLGDYRSALTYHEMFTLDDFKNDDEAQMLVELDEMQPSVRSPLLDFPDLPESIDFPNAMVFNECSMIEAVAKEKGVTTKAAKKNYNATKGTIQRAILEKENI